jgi:hypothetical protein
MRARLDKILNSWVSKKLTVFLIASFGLFSGTLTSEDWVTVASFYIVTQGSLDVILKLRNKSN